MPSDNGSEGFFYALWRHKMSNTLYAELVTTHQGHDMLIWMEKTNDPWEFRTYAGTDHQYGPYGKEPYNATGENMGAHTARVAWDYLRGFRRGYTCPGHTAGGNCECFKKVK